MKKEINAADVKLMTELQGSIPMSKRPFKEIANKLKMTEDEVVEKIQSYGNKKYYRRFGATLRHQKAGFKANGMVIWSVPDESMRTKIGERLASHRAVSHGYERPSFDEWPYHIYTMVHGETETEVRGIAKQMSAEVGITDYDVLFSTREFKKTSMRYFDNWPVCE
jgi:DNA-binding Lrp family transcriptional regulator